MNVHDIIPRPKCCDYKYEKDVTERFGPRVPGKVFDSHFHLSPKLNPKVGDDRLFDVWKECTDRYLGGTKIAGGLIMGTPKMFKTKEALDEARNFACSIAEDPFVANVITYASEWMWELANHCGMNMVVHLSHHEDLLCHPGNGGQIRELCSRRSSRAHGVRVGDFSYNSAVKLHTAVMKNKSSKL